MPLRISHKREEEVPTPNSTGKVNQDLMELKEEMRKLGSGMVLEIEAGSEKAVRGTKLLVSKGAKQLGANWRHWSVGTKVFAKPAEMIRRRRTRKTE